MRVVGKARRLVSASCHIESPLAPTDPNHAFYQIRKELMRLIVNNVMKCQSAAAAGVSGHLRLARRQAATLLSFVMAVQKTSRNVCVLGLHRLVAQDCSYLSKASQLGTLFSPA